MRGKLLLLALLCATGNVWSAPWDLSGYSLGIAMHDEGPKAAHR